jgi:hypothetical protein
MLFILIIQQVILAEVNWWGFLGLLIIIILANWIRKKTR